MTKQTRRDFLRSTAAVAAVSAWGVPGSASAAGPTLEYKPEEGAELRVLRWRRFVQGEEDQWMANTKKFTEQTGVKVRVDHEGFENIRPKAAVAARVGSGPDVILGWYDDPHQYPDKLLDVSELGEYLGNKYGGWYDVCKKYGKNENKWIAIPLGAVGNALVYRESMVKAAGFDAIPEDTAGFLKLCQALKAKGTPAAFALGHAVLDGNAWVHWLLWSHGGMVSDPKGNVVLDSPETVAALEYSKQLYDTFLPGTLSWQDPSNNKVFFDGQIGLTNNGISVYYAALGSKDPTIHAMATDIHHAHYPVGPVGKPTELPGITQMMAFKYTKYPNAAKAYIQFMMEADQYDPWMEASIGYVSQSLKAYEKNPIWTSDPKHTVYRDSASRMLDNGYNGPLGAASAAVMADYVILDMFASAASGDMSPQEAAKQAAERAKRYYKS
ncbi:ABC transporter substrate-binding protein [Pollutimonas harenae]|uniref:Carbohydrate ABC transporter substrate-binding protein n=1 Tax=Pollutimonas harenae TaxID=657015 RepID=A0A853H0W7_9BURK|nr:ABC transporter substrate-binding protein [Pollutimonas harenae]NYT85389.1 carbohydrate ABC transporter substrate-binding protein [Pollutimonas harenae]TEA70486.1 carbohydrate ABC transporter substrate-binding protein [Pollutimonas harenae]